MLLCFKGDYVWLETTKGEFDVAIGAKVVESNSREIKVVDDEGRQQVLPTTIKLKPMHVTSIQGVQDMILLGDLHEAGILRNLLMRYNENHIYVSDH